MKVIVLENLFSLASGRRGFGREPYFIAPRDCKPRQRVTKCLHSLYVRSRIAGIHHPFAPPALYHPSARPKRQINLPPDRSARCISDSNILHAICSKDRERERERERAVSNEIASPTTHPLFSQLLIQAKNVAERRRRGRSCASTDLTSRIYDLTYDSFVPRSPFRHTLPAVT